MVLVVAVVVVVLVKLEVVALGKVLGGIFVLECVRVYVLWVGEQRYVWCERSGVCVGVL